MPRAPGGSVESWCSGEQPPPRHPWVLPAPRGGCSTPKRPLLDRYLQNYVHNLFAGAWVPRDVTPLPVKVPLATEDEVGFVPRPASEFLGSDGAVFGV